MAPITIRAFVPSDIEAVMEIQRVAPEMAQWLAADYEGLSQQPGGLLLVAEARGSSHAGAIAAFVAGRSLGPEAELQNLAVLPGQRRRGCGQSLVHELHRQLKAAGVERVYLEVRASNLPALNLYKSFGYAECGRRRNYYLSDGEDALVLEVCL